MSTTRFFVAVASGLLLSMAGCTSSHSGEVAQLRAENQALRDQLRLAVGSQMREIIVAAVNFAVVHDRLPTKSSDLRYLLGEDSWLLFLAPYDRDMGTMEMLRAMDNPWLWIDEHGSFQWLDGMLYDHHSPVLVERSGDLLQPRWVFFGDAHGEQLVAGGAAWNQLGLLPVP